MCVCVCCGCVVCPRADILGVVFGCAGALAVIAAVCCVCQRKAFRYAALSDTALAAVGHEHDATAA